MTVFLIERERERERWLHDCCLGGHMTVVL